jgi:hypothetical protein
MANVKVINEVTNGVSGNWHLCFQWCEYNYDGGTKDKGYRFIWRRPDNSLQPARGQARIPNAAEMFQLMQLATQAGWFIHCEV